MKNTQHSFPPKIVVTVVYKTNQKDWRGFCFPYDVTCNAPTEKEAKKTIQEMVDLYEEGLKEYHFPKQLSIKPISNTTDKKVFAIIQKEIAKGIQEKVSEQFTEFQGEYEKRNEIKKNALTANYYYLQPMCA